jgi:hypothetical protein
MYDLSLGIRPLVKRLTRLEILNKESSWCLVPCSSVLIPSSSTCMLFCPTFKSLTSLCMVRRAVRIVLKSSDIAGRDKVLILLSMYASSWLPSDKITPCRTILLLLQASVKCNSKLHKLFYSFRYFSLLILELFHIYE